MDGRCLRCLAWGLLVAVGGCTHPMSMVRQSKSSDGTLEHQAATYEAFANYKAMSSVSPDLEPAQQQQAREDARLAYLKAIEVDPKLLSAYVGLARIQQASEDYPAAV